MGRVSQKVDAPIVVVFKTSSRSNAQTKMKVFKNKTVDEILDENAKLPGIPETAEWLEVGVGESFIDSYKKRYSL